MLHLQRTIGNQIVQRMVQTNAEELEEGSASTSLTRFAYDFSQIPVHPKSPAYVQAKLRVSPPGDSYEQEADRVSEHLMRMAEPRLQRVCACGGGCPTCQTNKQEHERLQAKRVQASDAGQTAVPAIVHEVLSSPGKPLDPATRAVMEPRFGHDFRFVQVHTDAKATESARAVNALAYTVGRDVVFGSGQYAPGTHEGRKLIAHELTHVVQQRQNELRPTSLTMGPAEDAFEAQAHSLPHQIINGSRAITSELRSSGTRLQRACGPAEIGSQSGCIGRGGDITDFGGDSGKIFRFRVGCDDLLPGEEARVQILASTISPDNQLMIDGFASEEGPADFNEELSCARAFSLASALIGAGISSNQIDGIYMHGATPGERADRRSAVISVVSSSSTRAPEDCGDLIGSCDYYLCRERQHPCGEAGYYKGYGYKYCERFSQLEPRLSAPGKDWVRKTLRCLQEHIDRNVPTDTPCPQVRKSAYDSHPGCYVRGGVCFLDPNEWLDILSVIDPGDHELIQVLLTGVSCIGNWIPVGLFPQHSLGAGGGFRGLMERDRQRMRRLMQPPPRGR